MARRRTTPTPLILDPYSPTAEARATLRDAFAHDVGGKPEVSAAVEYEVVPPRETGDAMRKDAGKTGGFWLLPTRPLEEVARLFSIGARKYSPRGWEAGMEWSRVLDPLFRHLFKWMRGERYDQVDGQHHLSSVIWACLVLMEYEETHPELDDIHPGKLQPKTPILNTGQEATS